VHAHDAVGDAICFVLKRVIHGTNGKFSLQRQRQWRKA
jgi:hypothetical protein